MTSVVRTDAPSTVRPGVLGLGAAAVAAMAGFRLGVLPGGLIGVDVALALLGAWLASPTADGSAPVARMVRAWRLLWVPTFAAVGLAVVWVLVEPSVRMDATVRGEGLAAFGGYANWHQFLVGPPETLTTRLASPLQHLWAPAVALQAVAVWWFVAAAGRRRRVRHPDRRPIEPAVFAVLGGASLVAGLGLLALGASGQTLLLATVPRASAFLLGAALGAAGRSSTGELLGSIAEGSRWLALVVLAVCAVFAGPMTTFGRVAGVTLVPIFAVVAVAASRGSAEQPDEGDVLASSRPDPRWSLLVAWWFVLTPVLAVVAAALSDAPTVVIDLVGLVLATLLTVPVAFACDRLSDSPGAVERRRVLAPPAAVALLVVLASVTGAFHWEGPQPRSQWPRPSAQVVGGGASAAVGIP